MNRGLTWLIPWRAWFSLGMTYLPVIRWCPLEMLGERTSRGLCSKTCRAHTLRTSQILKVTDKSKWADSAGLTQGTLCWTRETLSRVRTAAPHAHACTHSRTVRPYPAMVARP